MAFRDGSMTFCNALSVALALALPARATGVQTKRLIDMHLSGTW